MLTYITCIHITIDIIPQFWPPKIDFNLFEGLRNTHMSTIKKS